MPTHGLTSQFYLPYGYLWMVQSPDPIHTQNVSWKVPHPVFQEQTDAGCLQQYIFLYDGFILCSHYPLNIPLQFPKNIVLFARSLYPQFSCEITYYHPRFASIMIKSRRGHFTKAHAILLVMSFSLSPISSKIVSTFFVIRK